MTEHEEQWSISVVAEQLTNIVTELAHELFADVITLYLYDKVNNDFFLPVGYGLQDPETFFHPQMRPRSDRLAGKIIREGKPIIAERVSEIPELNTAFAWREGIKGTAGFPLVLQSSELDSPVGVLFVSYRTEHNFNDNDLNRIHNTLASIGAYLQTNRVFDRALNKSEKPGQIELALQALVNHACTALSTPTAIWVMDFPERNLILKASTGVTATYQNFTKLPVDSSPAHQEVIDNGHPVLVDDLMNSPKTPYQQIAIRAGWDWMIGYPIKLRNRVVGVIEVFAANQHREIPSVASEKLHYVSELATAVFENVERSTEAERLATIAQLLSASPDWARAMKLVVDSARELTKSDFSVLYLFEKSTQSFVLGARSPEVPAIPRVGPRNKGGLTFSIIDSPTDTFVHIGDTLLDPRVRQDVKQDGIRSLIGLRLKLAHEQIGVLYVLGTEPFQFDDHHVQVLKTLIFQASAALGWARLLLTSSAAIRDASSSVSKSDEILSSVCTAIKTSLGFDFVAIQLIRPREQFIETVYGEGIAARWSGRSRHVLSSDPELCDIQAEIALSKCSEILSGWDERFDRWIYDTNSHEKVVRIFTPLLLVRDINGKFISNWTELCKWQVLLTENSELGHRIQLSWDTSHLLHTYPEATFEVIGTIEAGFEEIGRGISIDQAKDLAELAAEHAQSVRSTQLLYTLEVIADQARIILQADSVTLHLRYKYQDHFAYEACTGQLPLSFLNRHPPRPQGLGKEAILARQPKVIPDLELGHSPDYLAFYNPDIYAEGVKAMMAIPLVDDAEGIEGVLYAHHNAPHRFTQDSSAWGMMFAQEVMNAIHNTTAYIRMRDRARDLEVLHTIGASLVDTPTGEDLLQRISWNTLNLLAADLVIIYEYDSHSQVFTIPPTVAGRLKVKQEMHTKVIPDDTPELVVRNGKNIYAVRTEQDPVLGFSVKNPRPDKQPFVSRENIVSSAAVLLRVEYEIVGIMFINYRRLHAFEEDEKTLIETLASSAAIAVRNSHIFTAFRDVEREIVTTLDPERLLSVIVKSAVSVTNADQAYIRMIDPVSHTFVVKAQFAYEDLSRVPTEIGKDYDSTNAGALISVPLTDKNKHIIGNVTVTRTQPANPFGKQDHNALQALANLAVIAIQNAEKQKQLLAAETLAALGDFAGPLVHDMANDISGISNLINTILESGQLNDSVRSHLVAVLDTAQSVVERAKSLGSWVADKRQSVNLSYIINSAISRVVLPSNVTVITNVPDEFPLIEGGSQQLQNVFSNLIRNAVIAMPDGGTLEIHSEVRMVENGCWLVTWVEDSGVGIPDEVLPTIFDRSKIRITKGLRFGLWWCKTYIEVLGGDLSVESEVGRGTRVRIQLPCATLY